MTDPGTPIVGWSLPADLDPGPLTTRADIRHPDPDPARIAEWLRTLGARVRSGAGGRGTVGDRARALGRIGAVFGDPTHPVTRAAHAALPANAGLSPEMAAHTLARMADTWTEASLLRLAEEHWTDRSRVPRSPQLHIGSGSVPGVTLTSCLRGLLVGAPVLAKPGAGDTVLTVLGRRILDEAGEPLANEWGVAYWPGRVETVTEALREAGVAVLYGDDDTVAAYRRATPAGTPVVTYPHRASAAVVGPDRMDGVAARALASAVAAYDRRGCVSPRIAYVVDGTDDGDRAAAFAAAVADGLAALERALPAGPGGAGLAAHRTAELQLVEGSGAPLRVLADPMGRWLVVLDRGAEGIPPLPAGRAIRIRTVPSLDAARVRLARWGDRLQTVGLAVAAEREAATREALEAIGATRIVPIEDMPWPPAWWRHDGANPLDPLLEP